MAFIPTVHPIPLSLSSNHQLSSNKSFKTTCRRHRTPTLCTPSSQSPPTNVPSTAPIPGSLAIAVSQAVAACRNAMSAGRNRLFVEIDTTNGDATYTMLKTSLPITRMLLPLFPDTSQLSIFLPDAGAAALTVRDWKDFPSDPSLPNYRILGMEQSDIDPQKDAATFIVVPRASEVNLLGSVVESAQDLPVLIVNPDLVDMGITGLSLNARNLRADLIDTFEQAYYLKVFPWGVLLRAYPGKWGVWLDAPGTQVGFRLVRELDNKPNSDMIDEILSEDDDGAGANFVSGLFGKFRRFLDVYMKG